MQSCCSCRGRWALEWLFSWDEPLKPNLKRNFITVFTFEEGKSILALLRDYLQTNSEHTNFIFYFSPQNSWTVVPSLTSAGCPLLSPHILLTCSSMAAVFSLVHTFPHFYNLCKAGISWTLRNCCLFLFFYSSHKQKKRETLPRCQNSSSRMTAESGLIV